jgi:D-alanine-D-alanine ligase
VRTPKREPVIAVLAGGTSAEREVSLGSGRAVAQAMTLSHPTELFQVDTDALPEGLDPERHVVCSTLHGVFGEDGGM